MIYESDYKTMMYCKGCGCSCRQDCARHILILAEHEIDRWVDHCIDGQKYIRVNTEMLSHN